MNRKINIGILGVGTVGTGVARILLEQKDLLATRTSIDFHLKTVMDIDWKKDRGLDLSGVKISEKAEDVLEDPGIDIVVETTGRYDLAFEYISRALENRKHVVTANKALIATKSRELFKLAKENHADIMFEASVGGGIPIIKGLREGLVANEILSIFAIINGTSNYILTRMHQDGLSFNDALAQAQEKGFAEKDPALDISGGDAAHKLAILASIASSSLVDFSGIHVEGITDITHLDIDFAKQFGYTVKLLAIYQKLDQGLDLRVHPTLVPGDHLLAAVSNELNAVFVNCDFVGSTMFYGPGAGSRPTGSAIVSDLVDLSRDLQLKEGQRFCNRAIDIDRVAKIMPMDEICNRYYLRMFTLDRPGILSKISGSLGRCNISISSVIQPETRGMEDFVPLVILTHRAREADMKKALAEISKHDYIKGKILRMRLF
ncbi:MAG: homoserine dehydrogenase [Bacillota bacterium]